MLSVLTTITTFLKERTNKLGHFGQEQLKFFLEIMVDTKEV